MRSSIAILIVLILLGCSNDVLESSYVNYSAILEDEAIERGWIPKWLPVTAISIHELHDVDTNQSTLVFKLLENSGWNAKSLQSSRCWSVLRAALQPRLDSEDSRWV
jgi:hypothetical protein